MTSTIASGGATCCLKVTGVRENITRLTAAKPARIALRNAATNRIHLALNKYQRGYYDANEGSRVERDHS
jgi:hypothetical protein